VTKREARPFWHGSLRHAAEVDARQCGPFPQNTTRRAG
jgi:hypothetical protein